MATESFYTESGSSPPRRANVPAPDKFPGHFALGFTPWAQPMLAVTDTYEVVVLGFKYLRGQGYKYQGVDGRLVSAEGTALFQLGAEGGAA